MPWRREWQPTLVFLPGEFHRQRSLMGYSPSSPKESVMTERLTLSLFFPPMVKANSTSSILNTNPFPQWRTSLYSCLLFFPSISFFISKIVSCNNFLLSSKIIPNNDDQNLERLQNSHPPPACPLLHEPTLSFCSLLHSTERTPHAKTNRPCSVFNLFDSIWHK